MQSDFNRHVLSRSLRVQIEPVNEVTRTPDAQLAAHFGHAKTTQRFDLGVANVLGAPWVVPTNREAMLFTTDLAIVVERGSSIHPLSVSPNQRKRATLVSVAIPIGNLRRWSHA